MRRVEAAASLVESTDSLIHQELVVAGPYGRQLGRDAEIFLLITVKDRPVRLARPIDVQTAASPVLDDVVLPGTGIVVVDLREPPGDCSRL
jgi:hypothetical protein